MRKKIIGCVLMATMMLAGCASKEKTITDQPKSSTESTTAESTTASASSYSGYVFESGSVSIQMDAEAAPYLEQLGEEESYYEASSCAFGDLDKVYTYNGFELDTYQVDGVDYVSAVILLDDTVTTPEGLSIGDSADKVTELYGAATTSDDTQIVYEKEDMKLIILLQDEVVTSIQYTSRVLD